MKIIWKGRSRLFGRIVRKMLDSLKNKISSDDIDWLTEICDEVFKGKRFADEDFNSLIEDFNRSWEET